MGIAAEDRRHERWIVVSLALAGFIATLDDYIVSVSLPAIAKDFDASTSQAALVTMAYLVALVATLLVFGRLGDRVGHRRVFLAGYLVFVLGSALCAVSPSLTALIAFRVLQGCGAAMLSVTGPALIAGHVGSARRGWAFGIFTTVTALGITLGAPLGGIITGLLSWHWVFAINVPIGIAAAVVAWWVIPRDAVAGGDRPRPGFDLVGAGLSTFGLLALLIGLNQGEELGGWFATPVIALFVSAIVLLGAFVWWELRVTDPLIELRALRDPVLSRGLAASVVGYMLLAGCNFVLPFYLIYVQGLRPEQVGLVMIAYSVVYVAASPLGGRWSDRFGARRLSAIGMLAAAGASALMVVTVGWAGLLLVVVYLVWRAASYAMFIAPNNALVMGAGADGHGRTSGMLKVSVNLGLVLGLVLFETLFSLPIAEGLGSLSSMLSAGKVDTATMLTGLRLAYGFGMVVCIVAASITLLARRRTTASRPHSATPVDHASQRVHRPQG